MRSDCNMSSQRVKGGGGRGLFGNYKPPLIYKVAKQMKIGEENIGGRRG